MTVGEGTEIIAVDVWWQLAAGRWIVETGIPTTDPFSYAFPDREWIELRWLYCLGLYKLTQAFGMGAAVVVKWLLHHNPKSVCLHRFRFHWRGYH